MAKENPRNIGLQIADAVELFDIPDLSKLKGDKLVLECGRIWNELSGLDPGFPWFMRAMAEHYWLQGTFCNLLYNVDPTRRKDSVLTREQYTAFRTKYLLNLSNDTLEDRRHVANRFNRLESRAKGYSEMVAICREERRLDREQSHKADGAGEKSSHPESGKKQVKISNVTKGMSSLCKGFEPILTLSQAPDRFDNPQNTFNVLDSLREQREQLINLVNRLDAEIDKTRRDVEKYVDDGRFPNLKKKK